MFQLYNVLFVDLLLIYSKHTYTHTDKALYKLLVRSNSKTVKKGPERLCVKFRRYWSNFIIV